MAGVQQPTQERVSYRASLIGTIQSHLAGLQGYDVMALELIQNADDARADSLIFDITDEGLYVSNSGQFSYCGNLADDPCPLSIGGKSGCDFHRITEVASGGKLLQSENIGRFGIGFVSSYQVTDRPEIRSTGIRLILDPVGDSVIEPYSQESGTTFFLPWATDPDSKARKKLGSPMTVELIDQLAEDFQVVLRKGLLFLRHLRKAEVRRNGQLQLGCELTRPDKSTLRIQFHPDRSIERWHILECNAKAAAEQLSKKFPSLISLNRSTQISIGLRMEPAPLTQGYLYAYLPTEQETGLPLHINADFFPEADRKTLIFSGHQHPQAWNEMLVDVAATEIAREPEALLEMLGDEQLWQIFSRAYDLSRATSNPTCFSRFWERLKATGSQSRIAKAQDGIEYLPGEVLFPNGALPTAQVGVLEKMGARVIDESLRQFRNALIQLGSPILTIERLVNLIAQAMSGKNGGQDTVTEKELEKFFRPLWAVVNDLLPDSGAQPVPPNASVQKLVTIPFIVTEDLYLVTIGQSYLTPGALRAAKVAKLLPRLAIASHHLLALPKLCRLISSLDLGGVAQHLTDSLEPSEPVSDTIGIEVKELRSLYQFFADLDRISPSDSMTYLALKSLPIWLSSKGLVRANQVLLPGDFIDPTGVAELLDATAFTDISREFVSQKLEIGSQSIAAFVQQVLPKFFSEAGPNDSAKYKLLLVELANHQSLVDDEVVRRTLTNLALIPTRDGGWKRPSDTYRRTEDLVKILGDNSSLWVDDSRIPRARSVGGFLDNLGLGRFPTPRHLVDRMLYIAKHFKPGPEARKDSSEAFYVLCDRYEDWKEMGPFLVAISDLRAAACFPEEDDLEQWYSASTLYAPARAEGFRTQAYILDFKNSQRIKTELLKNLGVSTEPETRLFVDHLFHCVEEGQKPHITTYQVLNERAPKGDLQIERLRGTPCIYVDSEKSFVRPNQIYWSAQQLGRHAFKIPGDFEQFKPLFDSIGVKNAPEAKDYVDLLLDIVEEYFERGAPLEGADLGVYETCLSGISSAANEEQLDQSDLRRLQEAPSVLSLVKNLTHPDELLLQDSEWHATFFDGDLNRALCKPAPELWPLLESIGVKRLSNCAEVLLEYVEGEKEEEDSVAEKLHERAEMLSRLLHDRPYALRNRISSALSLLEAISHDLVRIQAIVHVCEETFNAPPASAQAFFDIEKSLLILARPVGDRSWPHILNAIFHQLLPEESGHEISKLTFMARSLMAVDVEEGNRLLTEAGIPIPTAGADPGKVDLTSQDLSEIGTEAAPEDSQGGSSDTSQSSFQTEPAATVSTEKDSPSGDVPGSGDAKGAPNPGADVQPPTQGNQSPPGTEEDPKTERPPGDGPDSGEPNAGTSAGGQSHQAQPGSRSNQGAKKPRPKHKQQWDRRLISYVRKRSAGDAESEANGELSEHNLAVEAVARAAVCKWELDRGRKPSQMPQTHPGYDIISIDGLTGEQRFIEVKGVNGEWNLMGVGLSRFQFSNAQNYGDSFWLYVVEFVSDAEHISVHPIRNPAAQVSQFMFDGNWREAVMDERLDPAQAFVPGAQVEHKLWGRGTIEAVELRGLSQTRFMTINFGVKGRKPTTLNLEMMKVVEDIDGDDAA